jgi:L-alanine-DL-glutamate epimerase-like enolase superfamily enzyme
MRITDVEVINLQFGCADHQGFLYASGSVTSRTTSPIRALTDTDLVGLGAVYRYPDFVRVIVEQHLKPLLKGDDLLVEPPQIADGLLKLLDASGLGIELEQGTLDRFTWTKGTPLPDGKNSDLLFGAAYLVKAPARVIGRASAG